MIGGMNIDDWRGGTKKEGIYFVNAHGQARKASHGKKAKSNHIVIKLDISEVD